MIPTSIPTLSADLLAVKQLLSTHFDWLKSIGMYPNFSKTELVVFGHKDLCSIDVLGTTIVSKDVIKVLGVFFERNLKWNTHVNYAIKKAGSQTYSLRILNRVLPRQMFKQVIFSHFISHLMYASPVWAGNISFHESRRLETLLNKVLRLLNMDYTRALTNFQLHDASKIRTFRGLTILNDTSFLHSLCSTTNTPLALRLFEQSFTNDRYPERINFYDFSTKRIGKTSFINRAKQISELIPFKWPDLPRVKFKAMMKHVIGPTFGL